MRTANLGWQWLAHNLISIIHSVNFENGPKFQLDFLNILF